MALTTTTNSAAIAQLDTSITVASGTGFLANSLIRINGEWMKVTQGYVSGTAIPVIRGQDGTPQVAHAVTSNVTVGLASDFITAPPNVVVTTPIQPAFPLKAYGATGAIDVKQHIAVLNGTSVLAMTLAAPTKDMDGQMLIFLGNGKAAHTITYTAGFGANTTNSDVITFHATQAQCCMAIAANGVWNAIGLVTGGATAAGPSIG